MPMFSCQMERSYLYLGNQRCEMWQLCKDKIMNYYYFFDQMLQVLFFAVYYCAATIRGQPTIRGQCLLLRKTSRHQWRLDNVRMSDTVIWTFVLKVTVICSCDVRNLADSYRWNLLERWTFLLVFYLYFQAKKGLYLVTGPRRSSRLHAADE